MVLMLQEGSKWFEGQYIILKQDLMCFILSINIASLTALFGLHFGLYIYIFFIIYDTVDFLRVFFNYPPPPRLSK